MFHCYFVDNNYYEFSQDLHNNKLPGLYCCHQYTQKGAQFEANQVLMLAGRVLAVLLPFEAVSGQGSSHCQ